MRLRDKIVLVFAATLLAAGTVPLAFHLTRPAPVHATAAGTDVIPAVIVAEQHNATPTGDGYGGYGPPRTWHPSPSPSSTPRRLPPPPSGTPSPSPSPSPAVPTPPAASTPAATPPASQTPAPPAGTGTPTLPITGGQPVLVAVTGGTAILFGLLFLAAARASRRRHRPSTRRGRRGRHAPNTGSFRSHG